MYITAVFTDWSSWVCVCVCVCVCHGIMKLRALFYEEGVYACPLMPSFQLHSHSQNVDKNSCY
jgi:hypothetical protein